MRSRIVWRLMPPSDRCPTATVAFPGDRRARCRTSQSTLGAARRSRPSAPSAPPRSGRASGGHGPRGRTPGRGSCGPSLDDRSERIRTPAARTGGTEGVRVRVPRARGVMPREPSESTVPGSPRLPGVARTRGSLVPLLDRGRRSQTARTGGHWSGSRWCPIRVRAAVRSRGVTEESGSSRRWASRPNSRAW